MTEPSPDLPIVVQLQQRYAVPCARLFDAWLTPRTLGMWMFDPATVGGTVTRLDIEPRVGGALKLQVRRGEALVDHVARFDVLEAPRLIGFRWGAGPQAEVDTAQVRLAFEEETPHVCRLTLTHRMGTQWEAFADRTRAGWQGFLDGLQGLYAPPR